MSQGQIYGQAKIGDRDVVLRDLEAADIPSIVTYWHESEPEYLLSLGVDLDKLVSRDATRAAFEKSLPAERGPYDRCTLVLSDGSKVLGYSNLNYGEEGVGYAHVHILDPACRGMGFSSTFFALAVRVFYTHFPTRELRFQTNTVNEKISSFLAKMGMKVMKTEYVAKPDGMARPGHYNTYLVDRALFVRD